MPDTAPRDNSLCDKCGMRVPRNNDAVTIEMQMTKNWLLVDAIRRHFLPTAKCPGSPSRAQYIEGQPRDPRYPYDEEREGLWRKAYAEIQQTSHDYENAGAA